MSSLAHRLGTAMSLHLPKTDPYHTLLRTNVASHDGLIGLDTKAREACGREAYRERSA